MSVDTSFKSFPNARSCASELGHEPYRFLYSLHPCVTQYMRREYVTHGLLSCSCFWSSILIQMSRQAMRTTGIPQTMNSKRISVFKAVFYRKPSRNPIHLQVNLAEAPTFSGFGDKGSAVAEGFAPL